MEGEAIAVGWLLEQGFEILHRNWRHAHLEIDIIAVKDQRLHIVEVKARWSSSFGRPEEAVTRKKFRRLKRAADEYLYRNPGYPWFQYDILAITLRRGQPPEIFLLEDVFL